MTGADSSWVSICSVSDLLEDVGHCVLLGNRQLALFRLSRCEDLFAIDNFDPFSNANVLSRGVVGSAGSKTVVASPIYKQHFDLATGQCLEDASVTLPTFAVRVVDGKVQIFSQATGEAK